MTAPNAAAGDSTVLSGLSTPKGDEPADHHARKDEQADGDGEAEPEGQAGKSGHFTAVRREAGRRQANGRPETASFFSIRLTSSVFRFPARASI